MMVVKGHAFMKSHQKWFLSLLLAGSLGTALPMFAQDPTPSAPAPAPSGGWRRFDSNAPAQNTAQQNNPDAQQPADPNQPPPPRYQAPPPPPSNAPVKVTLPAGTWITVRVNEPISSDHAQAGDAFTASLAAPVIADGRVIARRGQMVAGAVTEAQKAGRVKGLSKLGLELTEMSLVDGRQVQMKTKLMERRGDTSYGRDAFAIGATTATGAAIGAAVNGGVGAGVGAAAGLVVSTIGVLFTRGRPTIVYPEQALTFRLETPLTIEGTEAAFVPAAQANYQQQALRRPPPPGYGPGYPAPYGYAAPPPPPYYYGPYGPIYYGGYFGPYYGYGFGPGFYFSYRGGFRRW